MDAEVGGILHIAPSTARALLMHTRWNKHRLFERYFSAEQAKLFDEARVVKPSMTATTFADRDGEVRPCARLSMAIFH